MTLQEQYDEAMFAFSQGDFAGAMAKLRAVLAEDATHFEAQLALGMACYRAGDLPAAIVEGHKAEKLRPKEQLAHTNLSLFYMKSGNLPTAGAEQIAISQSSSATIVTSSRGGA